MKYEDVIRDFAIRTKKNLAIIEELQREGKEAYGTTQLVNSCLGLMVFPQQHFIDRIPETPTEQLAQEGWPIPKVTGNFRQATNLKDLIRYLRNAITHFNIEFIGDANEQIRFLRVWNTTNPNNRTKRTKTWEAELSVDDLRRIVEKFCAKLIDYGSR